MKIAYHANDAIDAQLVCDILNDHDIFAQVRGAHMQGAVGEAAAMGNVKVWINDQDLTQAKSIIQEWESAEFAVDDAELFEADTGEKLFEEATQHRSNKYANRGGSFFLVAIVAALLFVGLLVKL